MAGRPGTLLKKTLHLFGFSPTAGCNCNSVAEMMDRQGVEWCRKNVTWILDNMEKSARKQKVKWRPRAARILVDRVLDAAELMD